MANNQEAVASIVDWVGVKKKVENEYDILAEIEASMNDDAVRTKENDTDLFDAHVITERKIGRLVAYLAVLLDVDTRPTQQEAIIDIRELVSVNS